MKIEPTLKEDLKRYLEKKLSQKEQQVTLVAPYKLRDDELEAITHKIPVLKNAIIEQQQDSSLLGGFIIKFGSKMIDLSLKTELHKLQQRIYEII